MQIPRLYTPQKLIEGQTVSLDKHASQHLLRVLRARVNDPVIVFNGEGGEYHGTLVDTHKNQALIKLYQHDNVDRESPLAIHLFQGISRGERMDYVIQKAVELGVASITPLFTERCTVKLSGDRLEKRLDHWRSIVVSACEQSGRCRPPDIKPAVSFADGLAQQAECGFICDTESSYCIHDYPKLNNSASLFIGPEGGFAAHEIQLAKNNAFNALSLGPRILRTETAPVVAITLLQHHGGDF